MCSGGATRPLRRRRRAVITDGLRHGRHLRAPAVVAGALAATVAAGSLAVWASTRSSSPARVEAAAPGVPVPSPVLTAGTPTGPHTAVPWQSPLTLTVTGGAPPHGPPPPPPRKPVPGGGG